MFLYFCKILAKKFVIIFHKNHLTTTLRRALYVVKLLIIPARKNILSSHKVKQQNKKRRRIEKIRFHWSEKLKFPCISFCVCVCDRQYRNSIFLLHFFILLFSLFNDIAVVFVVVAKNARKKSRETINFFFDELYWKIMW